MNNCYFKYLYDIYFLMFLSREEYDNFWVKDDDYRKELVLKYEFQKLINEEE